MACGHGKGKKTSKREKGKPLAPMGQGSMSYSIPKKSK
jgi:hypothetical protein